MRKQIPEPTYLYLLSERMEAKTKNIGAEQNAKNVHFREATAAYQPEEPEPCYTPMGRGHIKSSHRY